MTAPESIASSEVRPYLETLERRLANLSQKERVVLLADLESHLEEVLTDESGAPLADRIGSPDAYADEFAASVGLSDTPKQSRSLEGPGAELPSPPPIVRARSPWPEMRPAWWALMGTAIGLLLVWSVFRPDTPGFSPLLQLLAGLIVGGIVGLSMRIGRNGDRNRIWRALSYAVTIAGLIAGVSLAANVSARLWGLFLN